jgi:hypothetical protein
VFECPTWLTTPGSGSASLSGAFVTRSGSRPNCTPGSSGSRRPSGVGRWSPKRGGPTSPMLLDITIRCTWCTISTGCRETVRQPSAVNSTCLCNLKLFQSNLGPVQGRDESVGWAIGWEQTSALISQLPDCRQTGSNPRTGSRKSLRWFPLMPDMFPACSKPLRATYWRLDLRRAGS